MAEYTYDTLKEIIAKGGGLGPAAQAQAEFVPQQITGTATIDLSALQAEVEALKFEGETDQTFDLDIQVDVGNAEKVLKIDDQKINTYVASDSGGSAILNSDRIIINAKNDFAMMFGQEGVALGSPNKVNIDAGKTITLFGQDALYLGLPHKGGSKDEYKNKIELKKGKSVGDPTRDEEYEPMVLGLKLINFIEDLIVTLGNAKIATPTGNGVFQPSAMAEFELLKLRLPELISEYAYVDGITHGQVDPDQLKVVKKQKEAAKDFVAPTKLVGSIEGTTVGPVIPSAPANPVTSPYAALPGYFETPTSDPYGDSGTL